MMTRTEMFEQLVAKLTADNERLVSDLRNLDEIFRNATDQSNRATQALMDERAENARLLTENATIDRRYHEFLRDWADMDTHVRNAAKTVLAAPAVDGNSYGVPTIEDVADMLVADNARLREALEDAFDYVLELSALKRGDAQLDRYCTDLAQFLDKEMGITNETPMR